MKIVIWMWKYYLCSITQLPHSLSNSEFQFQLARHLSYWILYKSIVNIQSSSSRKLLNDDLPSMVFLLRRLFFNITSSNSNFELHTIIWIHHFCYVHVSIGSIYNGSLVWVLNDLCCIWISLHGFCSKNGYL